MFIRAEFKQTDDIEGEAAVTAIFYGRTSAGLPLYDTLAATKVSDLDTALSDWLNANSVTWGITDDIT